MIFGQLKSATMWLAKFHAYTTKSLSDFWPPLFEQPINFVFICKYSMVEGATRTRTLQLCFYLTKEEYQTKLTLSGVARVLLNQLQLWDPPRMPLSVKTFC